MAHWLSIKTSRVTWLAVLLAAAAGLLMPSAPAFAQERDWQYSRGKPDRRPVNRRVATSLMRIEGTASARDAVVVRRELLKLPHELTKALAAGGAHVSVCRGSVTEVRSDLKGVRPRGWPEGATWDTVPGLYQDGRVIIATTGSKTRPRVPGVGEGHGSRNLVLHETMHAYDRLRSVSSQANFQTARRADLSSLCAYQRQVGTAGLQETFAESGAKFYGGCSLLPQQSPGLTAFFRDRRAQRTPATAAMLAADAVGPSPSGRY